MGRRKGKILWYTKSDQSKLNDLCFLTGDLRQLLLWGIRNNISWNAPRLGFSSRVFLTGPPFLTCTQPSDKSENTLRNHHKLAKRSKDPGEDTNDALYIEILEAVCNESIPGLPGISNFTIYLYCNLLNRSFDAAHPSPDIRATCSDAAWYLSAVEEDFYWVQVCSQFYATEFNSTVCTNVSLLSQQDLKQPWIVHAPKPLNKCNGPEILDITLEELQECIFQNGAATLWSLCSSETLMKSEEQGKAWIIDVCSQLEEVKKELDWDDEGLKETICWNTTLFRSVLQTHPWVLNYCSEFDKPQEEKCFLQHLLDVLPIPFNFNTTQLCSNPTAFVIELLDRFSRCDDEAFGWISNANYILRVLEFVLDFSGLDQSGKEVQDELSEAILLSNLLDNTSFWASFQPNASVSILQTVDTYLKKEKNIARKNDLLSCFSVSIFNESPGYIMIMFLGEEPRFVVLDLIKSEKSRKENSIKQEVMVR
uniref:Stereocilin LRR domain-containing protein n=1 Tax=Callorhinchus milii TaxID=7868 RepID=A0A4W3HQF6_CALMI